MKRVAIIGGGYTGLCSAKKLLENGFDVTIYEKTTEIGGMAKCIDFNNTKIEKHYRHIFKSDKYVIELLKEFDLLDKMQWNETKMAYYSKGKGLYEFGTPISLLKYKPLTFIEKIRFGISIITIKLINNYKKLENYTAEDWIKKNCGDKVYSKIWEPLLITKFGKKKSEVSMAWLWGKIKLRGSSSTAEGEKLGYLEGSYDVLTNKLERHLLQNNCNFKMNKTVDGVFEKNGKYIIQSDGKEEVYDFIISTVSYDIASKIFDGLLTDEENKRMQELNYTFAKTLIIYSKKSLTPFYWINIGDTDIPFGGIIEHTNMIDKETYNGDNVIYISNYMDKNDKLYKMNAEQLLDKYFTHLKKINKDFNKNDIIKVQCFEEEYAQPIITTNYSCKMLDMKLKDKGIFIANMAQIYPEDRGMNYAIKKGYEVAEKIIAQI